MLPIKKILNHITYSSGIIVSILIMSLCVSCNSSKKSGVGTMDWQLFRGNTSLSGYTRTAIPDDLKLLWTYKGGMRTVSSPTVLDGTTYWVDRKGKVKGVDINGREAFEHDLKNAVESTPLIHDSTLYIGNMNGIMTAISLATADTLWTYETLGQISSPPNIMAINGQEAVVFGSYDSYLYCVNTATGKLINRFETGYYLNGAASLWNNHVVFGGCDGLVRVINCETGIQTDSLKVDTYVPSSPAIMGDYCYVGDNSGSIYKLMLEKGKIIRHFKIHEASSDSPSYVAVPAISSEIFYFYNSRYLTAISRRTGKELWKYMLKGDVGESSPLVCNDKLIACTKTGIVSILDAKSGDLLWEYDCGEQIIGSPAVISEHVMILSSKGTLFCFGKEQE